MRLAISIAGLLLFNAALAAAQDDAQTLAQLGVKEAPVALREMRGWRPPKKIVVAVSDPRRLAGFGMLSVAGLPQSSRQVASLSSRRPSPTPME